MKDTDSMPNGVEFTDNPRQTRCINPLWFVVISLIAILILFLRLEVKIAQIESELNTSPCVVFDWVDINNPYNYETEQKAEIGYLKATELVKHFKHKGYIILDVKNVDYAPENVLINAKAINLLLNDQDSDND